MKSKEVALTSGIAILSSYFVWELVDLFLGEKYSPSDSLHKFYIYAAAGILLILIGLFLKQNVVAPGIMFGGILLIASSTLFYVWEMNKLTRLVVIFLELILLIYVSMKKLRK